MLATVIIIIFKMDSTFSQSELLSHAWFSPAQVQCPHSVLPLRPVPIFMVVL